MIREDETAFEEWFELLLRIQPSENRREILQRAWMYAVLYNTYERGVMRATETAGDDANGTE